ncbi:unnamed protein product [Acanthosepion pharaonis]|uniref:Uncharacterized protein n=1 Tax=Acanthosepion pharaonis TaxID=158019 RepID=A0A812B1M5_ACAPH|nr:unnamed protein product [Sepia pharaonis]
MACDSRCISRSKPEAPLTDHLSTAFDLESCNYSLLRPFCLLFSLTSFLTFERTRHGNTLIRLSSLPFTFRFLSLIHCFFFFFFHIFSLFSFSFCHGIFFSFIALIFLFLLSTYNFLLCFCYSFKHAFILFSPLSLLQSPPVSFFFSLYLCVCRNSFLYYYSFFYPLSLLFSCSLFSFILHSLTFFFLSLQYISFIVSFFSFLLQLSLFCLIHFFFLSFFLSHPFVIVSSFLPSTGFSFLFFPLSSIALVTFFFLFISLTHLSYSLYFLSLIVYPIFFALVSSFKSAILSLLLISFSHNYNRCSFPLPSYSSIVTFILSLDIKFLLLCFLFIFVSYAFFLPLFFIFFHFQRFLLSSFLYYSF